MSLVRNSAPPTRVFISHSQQDAIWRDRLVAHLRSFERQGILTVWDTSSIRPGSDWHQEIDQAITKAQLAVLLISPDYLASNYAIQQELPRLMHRRESGDLTILPLIVRASSWVGVPELAGLSFITTDEHPLALGSPSDVDQALAAAARRIAEVAAATQERGRSGPKKRRRRPSMGTESQPAERRPEFFISHSKIDADFAELLQHKLEDEDLRAWIDSDRLAPGADWGATIDDAIRKCVAVIVIMSPSAKASEYVAYEWAFAWGCQKHIVPIILVQTPIHPRLATLQFLDFSNRSSRPWSRLIAELKQLRHASNNKGSAE